MSNIVRELKQNELRELISKLDSLKEKFQKVESSSNCVKGNRNEKLKSLIKSYNERIEELKKELGIVTPEEREQLRTNLFDLLNKNNLNYSVSGEGEREIITIPRESLIQIKDNEKVCSAIIDCLQANFKLNLLGAFECPDSLKEKVNNLLIDDTIYYADLNNDNKLIFNKPNYNSKEFIKLNELLTNHVTELLNDEDIYFSVEDIVNSCHVVVPQFSKSLIEEIVSNLIKDNKSFIARENNLSQSDMDKIMLGGSAFLAGGCLIDDDERKMFSGKDVSDSAINFFIKHATPESVKVGTELTEKERDNLLSDTMRKARQEIALRNSDNRRKAKNELIKFLNENNIPFTIETDRDKQLCIMQDDHQTLHIDYDKNNMSKELLDALHEADSKGVYFVNKNDYEEIERERKNNRAITLEAQKFFNNIDTSKLTDSFVSISDTEDYKGKDGLRIAMEKLNTRATSDELKEKEKELIQELKGEINKGDLVNRFGKEIADLIVEARLLEQNGDKENYFKCFEEAIDILNYGTTKEEAGKAINKINRKINNGYSFRREPLSAEEIRDSYFGKSIADKIGASKEEVRELFDAMWKYNDSHENEDLNAVKKVAEQLGLNIVQSTDKLDLSYNEEVLISLSLNSEINKKISIVCDYLDRGINLYPQPVHDDWYMNDSNGNTVVVINANEEKAFFEFMREYRHPSSSQFSTLSVGDYCKIFNKYYFECNHLENEEIHKYLLNKGFDIRKVRELVNKKTGKEVSVFSVLDCLNVYDFSNYELTLFCYFVLNNFTNGAIDSIDNLVSDYCESKGKIGGSFFDTSVIDSDINEVVSKAYEETKNSYSDLLRIYLKKETADNYNRKLRAYNEIQEVVEKENDIVRKEELIKESKDIMTLANTYRFSDTSIDNIQLSKLEMEMSNRIYKMIGKDLYFKYFDFISLSCIAGSRRIVYISDKENEKYGDKTISEEMSDLISKNSSLGKPNRTIVAGMDYNYMKSLTPEYRTKLVRKILTKDVFFGFATDIMNNTKVKNCFEISCRRKQKNGILIDTVLVHYNDELFMFRDGEFVSLKNINYEAFDLIANCVKYGIVACLDTKAYDKINGFYKRDNYSDDIMNRVVNLEKFVNTVYDGFSIDEGNMQLVFNRDGSQFIKAISEINKIVSKVIYVI